MAERGNDILLVMALAYCHIAEKVSISTAQILNALLMEIYGATFLLKNYCELSGNCGKAGF